MTTPIKHTIVQSISGGMDSTALLLHHLAKGREVELISFDYGQKHKLELSRLDANIEYLNANLALGHAFGHSRLSVPFGGLVSSSLTTKDEKVPEGFYAEDNMKSTVVPNRNMIFFSLVGAVAVSKRAESKTDIVNISLGVHAGDHAIYPDCRVEFYGAALACLKQGNWGAEDIGLKLPFIAWDKEEILRDALESCEKLNLDFDTVFANTNTSYAPDEQGRANGYTGSDVERILAFHALGREDPVEYVDGWETVLENALDVERKFNEEHGIVGEMQEWLDADGMVVAVDHRFFDGRDTVVYGKGAKREVLKRGNKVPLKETTKQRELPLS